MIDKCVSQKPDSYNENYESEYYQFENRDRKNFINKYHCAIFELSETANRLYDFYQAVSFGKAESFYSIKEIATILNLSYSTINRANNELIEKEYIAKKKRYNNSNIIILLNLKNKDKNILDYIKAKKLNDNLIVQNDNLIVQNDNLIVQNDNLIVQNDNLIVQNDNLIVQNDNLIVQNEQSNNKQINNKQSNNKQSNNKQSNNKQSNNKQSNNKQGEQPPYENSKNDNLEEGEAPSCKLQFDDFVGLILKACEELTAQTCVAIESVKSFRCHGRIEKLKELYDNPKSEALDCLNKAKAIAAKDKPSFRLESFASNLLVLLQNGIDDIEDITVDIENNEFESLAKVDDIEYTQATSYDTDKFIKAVKYWLVKITNGACKTYKSYELEALRTAFENRKNHAGHVLIYSADWALDNKQYAYFNFYKKLLELLTLDFDNWKNHRLCDLISSVRMEGKSKKRIKTLNLRQGAIKHMVETEKPARSEPRANEGALNQIVESENRADITPEEQATINDIRERLKFNMSKAFAF